VDWRGKMASAAVEGALMRRIAATRLDRFIGVATAAEQSGSSIWIRLAQQAAFSAFRDCSLLRLPESTLPLRLAVVAPPTVVDVPPPRRDTRVLVGSR
jgi:hypothetical protein